MAFFGGRASMLEVQNRALVKTAGERARRIGELEGELQRAGQMSARLKEEMDRLRAEMKRLKTEMERLKLEREFYYNRTLALEEYNGKVTESANQHSLWGQSLERELAKIDPAGALTRQFGHWAESQASTLKKRP
jgi:chromosome segregation ATPase